MTTRPQQQPHDASRSGVALILCLGILSIMTILSVAFAISMRVERMAARNFVNGVRAEHLIQVSFGRAIEHIHTSMREPVVRVYPDWSYNTQWKSDAMCSLDANSADVDDMITGEVSNAIPAGYLMNQARQLTPQWITNEIKRGRIAFIVVNTSGTLDANFVSGTQRVASLSPYEIDISGLPEFLDPDTTTFVSEREDHIRFETMSEISGLSSAIEEPVQNLSFFSFDPGPDSVFLTVNSSPSDWWTYIDTDRPPARLGTREAINYLHDKFDINSITNYPAYHDQGNPNAYTDDATFIPNYLTPLEAMLTMAGIERPDDVAWNIVNYLDPDRIPQSSEATPWNASEGGEAIPLINEIVIQETSDSPMWVISATNGPGWDPTGPKGYSGTVYKLSVELWYPFAPVDVKPSDNFKLQLTVFRALELGVTPPYDTELTVTNSPLVLPQLSKTWNIDNMEFGASTEFFVRDVTFACEEAQIGGGNDIWILIRVLKIDNGELNIVDEAMGYQAGGDTECKRLLFHVEEEMAYAVNDPRSNGQVKYWVHDCPTEPFSNGARFDPNLATLGTTNLTLMPVAGTGIHGGKPICDPWDFKGTGVPIYATNGVMRNISELGHIWRSNLDDEEPGKPNDWFWRNINLMRSDEGAMLMDIMTVRPRNKATRGLFSINSRQWDVLATVFTNLYIGIPGVSGVDSYPLDGGDVADLIDQLMTTNCVSFTDLFTDEDSTTGGGGDIADAFRQCAPNGDDSNDIYKEDTFRHMAELVTFRQNIFTVIMLAQALAPKADYVVAERRAVATVYRDAYTGRYFTRSFKWLTD